jgi:hypothetical protein
LNRAFYIIAIPAFIVSFCWLYYGWGLQVAIPVIVLELVAAIGGVMYLRRKARLSEHPAHGSEAAHR